MTKDIYLVDPDIHPTVVESLRAADFNLCDSPSGVSAFVTQGRDVDERLLEEAGDQLQAVFLLEPGSAKIVDTPVPVHSIGNSALLGVAEHTVLRRAHERCGRGRHPRDGRNPGFIETLKLALLC